MKQPLIVALFAAGALGLDNGLVLPPMGFNSWNKFACDPGPSESLIREIVDSFVSSGLRDAGYRYVNIDDCWQEMTRAEDGSLLPNATRFPNGMKAVADYVHANGLKFGIYNSAGLYTCAGYPGSQGHEIQDAATFAAWEIDLLKYDNCYAQPYLGITRASNIARFTAMRDALNATGRQIFYSMCNWGQASSWEFAADIANSWRISGDIGDSFDRNGHPLQCGLCTAPGPCLIIRFGMGASKCSVSLIADVFASVASHGNVGAYSDLDMLEVGNGGMTLDEYRSHFTLWAAAKSPLLLGNDVRDMSADVLEIVTNREIIALNQDRLGVPVNRTHQEFDFWGYAAVDVWTGPLADGSCVLIVWNRVNAPTTYAVSLTHSFFAKTDASTRFKARDLWKHADVGTFDKSIVVELAPHGVVALKLTREGSISDEDHSEKLIFAEEDMVQDGVGSQTGDL